MENVLTEDEIKKLGFKHVGKNVVISKKASFYSPEEISIGDHVRIDDFCVLSGKIEIGNYVHVAVYSAIFGGREGVFIADFCNISSRVIIYAVSDDFSGETMTSPLIPEKYKNVTQDKVVFEKHVIVGTSSVVLPGSYLSEGAAFGAFSLIKGKVDAWTINVGIPCKKIKERSRNILELEKKFVEEQGAMND